MKLANEELIVIAKGGNKEAERMFFEQNEKFPHWIARRFQNTGVDQEDLASIATVGFMKAYNTFDPDKNIKFATYASRCMDNEILMFLRRNKRHAYGTTSIDDAINVDWDGNELTLMDVLDSGEDVLGSLEQRDTLQTALDFIKSLPERERSIIEMRFIEEKTQAEVAEALNISQSYISRLERKVQRKVKAFTETGKVGNARLKPVTNLKESVDDMSKVKTGQVKYIMENYPWLKQADIARIFGVTSPAISTHVNVIKSGRAVDMDDSIEPQVQAYLHPHVPTNVEADPTYVKPESPFTLPQNRNIGGTETGRIQTSEPNHTQPPRAEKGTEENPKVLGEDDIQPGDVFIEKGGNFIGKQVALDPMPANNNLPWKAPERTSEEEAALNDAIDRVFSTHQPGDTVTTEPTFISDEYREKCGLTSQNEVNKPTVESSQNGSTKQDPTVATPVNMVNPDSEPKKAPVPFVMSATGASSKFVLASLTEATEYLMSQPLGHRYSIQVAIVRED